MTRSPNASFATMCAAPFTSLHLDPHGVVRVCGENKLHVVGRIPDQTLTEIWTSEAVDHIRVATRSVSFELGCEGCRWGIESGDRSGVRAGVYDHLVVDRVEPPNPVRLELELTNSCNLQCVMCNGDLSSSIRTHREGRPPLPVVYDDRFFEEFETLVPSLTEVTLLGGEPFLGRETLRAFDILAAQRFQGMCHVTTNGTIRTRRVERLIDELRINVAVSVDGVTAATVESIRVGASFEALRRNIEWFRRRADERGTTMVVHFCLMRQNWRELRPFLAWADELDVDAVVIEVRHPLSLGIGHLDGESLQTMVTEMLRQDDTAPALGRNRGAWVRELEWLRSLAAAAARHDEPGTSVSLDTTQRAVADLRRWADERGVADVELDLNGCIADTTDLGDVLGMDLRPVKGAPLAALMSEVTDHFGTFTGSQVLDSPPGAELRSLAFAGPTHTTTLRSLHFEATADRPAQIHLAARSAPLDRSGTSDHSDHSIRSGPTT